MDTTIAVILTTAVSIATVTDLQSQRIPNWLTFPLMLAGLGYHTWMSGLGGLTSSAQGFGLGLAFMIVPFFAGVMGAGDVKLMAAIGAWLGPNDTTTAFLFTCLIGGLYAVIILLRHLDKFKAILANIYHNFMVMFASGDISYSPLPEDKKLPRLCYGIAIAAGTIITMGMDYLGADLNIFR
ncbi:MAG: A24 family peptidase [Desulfovibrio sp.]